MFTSLKLSKKLSVNGFEGESEEYHRDRTANVEQGVSYPLIKKYDILNDLCVKYAKEMFGEEEEANPYNCGGVPYEDCENCSLVGYIYHSENILSLLQQNKQDEAEEYLWENCKFNKNN